MGIRTSLRDLWGRSKLGFHVAQQGNRFSLRGCEIEVPFQLWHQFFPCSDPYEREELDALEKHLPRDLPVIELGGSIGATAAIIRSTLNPGVRHLVVEAAPHLIAVCKRNATQGATDTATEVIHAAVSYDGPWVEFAIDESPHLGALGIRRDLPTIQVPTTTLERLHRGLGSPDDFTLVSDIEGAEYLLFEHDSAVLKHARRVIMEIHPWIYPRFGGDEARLLDNARSAGLSVMARHGDVVVLDRAAA